MKLRSGLLQIAVIAGLFAALAVTMPVGAAGTCYVNDNASGTNNGTDWANAYTSLQSALADSCTEIWAAAGTYKPDTSAPFDDRTLSFALETGTAIYGGFAGTETLLSQRDPVANVTILSGDLNGDDSGFTNNGENSYHVVYADSVDNTAVLDGFTISGGNANGSSPDDRGGGIYANNTGATLANLTLRYNVAGYGGGMYAGPSTTSTLTNVTFKDNASTSAGGGLYMTIATVSLSGVTFSNNTSYAGGGMAIANQLPTLTNVTFSGNSATLGGGLYLYSTQPTLTNVTFSGNSATVAAGGLYVEYTSVPKLTNVIIANSTNGDCVINSGSINGASSNNLIEDTGSNACGLTNGVNGDIIGTDPILGPLADNGGPTQTFALLTGSPAIDAGTNTGCPATDQRGGSRPQNSTCDIGAVELALQSGSTRTVTKLTDTDDSCDVLNCSLREAIASAASGNTITFDSSLSGGTITLTSDTLNILTDMTIDGSALASKITISGNNALRVFSVGGGVTATLNSLIVTQGRLDSDGGGSGLVNNGTLTITNSLFSANTNDSQYGGAIRNNSTGNLTITGSTFSNNSAFSGGAIANYNQLTVKNSTFIDNGGAGTDSGGAIYTDGDPGTLTQITNSTFSGNTANIGGALWGSRTQTITNSTFSGNVANYANSGGAVWQDREQLNYANTIMANSTSDDCHTVSAGNIGTNTNNLVETTNHCAPALSVDPNLDDLDDYGGPSQTFALLPGSPAINAGDDATCTAAPVSGLDQRGIARPNGDHCDLGAYEHVDTGAPNVTAFNATDATSLSVPITSFTVSEDGLVTGYKVTESSTPPSAGGGGWTASAPSSFTVASTGSHTLYPWAKDDAGNVSAVYGSGDTVSVCLANATVLNNNDTGAGSLRQAISDACAGGTIEFDSGLSGATINLTSTLDISKSLTIDGSDLTSKITISGDSGPTPDGVGDVRIFHITNVPGISVTLDSLIITKGQSSNGGAIRNERALTVKNSLLSNNSSSGSGGAITADYTLTIIDSTFSGNSATGTGSQDGGGAILQNVSSLTISGSTFSNNTANNGTSSGGAIFNAAGPSTISNSTFSGNSAVEGGAIITIQNLTITNSTISGNSATATGGLEVAGGTINLKNTIVANSTGGDCGNFATIGTNLNNLIEDGTCSPALSGDPMLGSLANNGGSTQTFALLPGSKAIDAGDDATCNAAPISGLDQRGTARPNSAHCDIGAYEYVDTTAPTITAFTATSPSSSRNIPITAFVAADDATVAGYLITESTTPPTAGAAGWTVAAPTTYSAGSAGSHTLYPWAKDAAGHVSAVYGSPASVTVDVSAPTAGGLVAANVTIGGGTTYSFTVTFSDNLAIDSASLGNSDIRVSGPGGFTQLATLVSVTPLGNGTPRTATYQITAPGGAWDSGDNGTYTLALEANQVIDTAGNPIGATTLGGFLVSLNYTLYLPLVQR